MFKCTVCGYIHDGDAAPESCPKCGAPASRFERVADDAAALIDRSRHTNGLHMQLINIFEEVIAIADEGIRDDLDPPCVKVFTRVQDDASELVQSMKAELAGHMSKGKWG